MACCGHPLSGLSVRANPDQVRGKANCLQGVRMFFTYLGRELRRRARQASIIAIGLALGIGLVITVTALSSGVKNAQGEVLHSLYGQDTDITITKPPAEGSFSAGGGARFRFGGSGTRPKA